MFQAMSELRQIYLSITGVIMSSTDRISTTIVIQQPRACQVPKPPGTRRQERATESPGSSLSCHRPATRLWTAVDPTPEYCVRGPPLRRGVLISTSRNMSYIDNQSEWGRDLSSYRDGT